MADDKNVAIDESTSRFLDAEQAAHTLVSSLSRLEDEANRYSSAATNLDEAAQSTRELVVAIRGVGEEAAKALEVVSSVGGPKILEQLSVLESQIAIQSEVLRKKAGLAAVFAGMAALFALVGVVIAILG